MKAFLSAAVTSLAIICDLIGASPVSAQVLRGRVVAENAGSPLSGAVIHARDSDGATLGTAQSNEDGRFLLHVSPSLRYEIHVVRIGFRPTHLTVGGLGPGEERVVDIVMVGEPLRLATVEVRADSRCRMSDADRERLVQVLARARDALGPHVSDGRAEVTQWVVSVGGTEDGPLTLPDGFLIWNPNRRFPKMDSAGARVELGRSFLGTTQPEVLAAHGYVRPGADLSMHHDVPTPVVILSDAFLATHCFAVEEGGRGSPDWVGLGFRPIEEPDSVTGIAGTLWLDETTAEVRRLDFEYRNLPRVPFQSCVAVNRPQGWRRGESRFGPYCSEPHAGGWRPRPPEGTGGTLHFTHLASGGWFVSAWMLRTPGEEFVDRYAGFSTRAEQRTAVRCNDRPAACTRVYVAVPRLVVTSGAVASLLVPGLELHRNDTIVSSIARIATLRAGRSPAHLTGVVTDAAGRPVARALVTTDPPARVAWTDEQGRFEIRTLPVGPVSLEIRHASSALLRLTVVMTAGATRALDLRLAPGGAGVREGTVTRGRLTRNDLAATYIPASTSTQVHAGEPAGAPCLRAP